MTVIYNLRRSKWLKLSVLILTLGLFAIYAHRNWSDFQKIQDISLLHIGLILIGQFTVMTSNIVLLSVIVKFDNKHISAVDAARVTTYSSLINFFGFLQAGVGFRGGYLKKYLGMSLKRYSVLTILQYLCVFGISLFLIIAGYSLSAGHRAPVIILSSAAICTTLVIVVRTLPWRPFKLIVKRIHELAKLSNPSLIITMLLAATLQLAGSGLAFGAELHGIGANVTLGGFLIYTGLAQFSIVFAITPGAIGIRETLLLMVQSQMLLSTSEIVIAATIDRVIYCLSLLLVTPIAFSLKNRVIATSSVDPRQPDKSPDNA